MKLCCRRLCLFQLLFWFSTKAPEFGRLFLELPKASGPLSEAPPSLLQDQSWTNPRRGAPEVVAKIMGSVCD